MCRQDGITIYKFLLELKMGESSSQGRLWVQGVHSTEMDLLIKDGCVSWLACYGIRVYLVANSRLAAGYVMLTLWLLQRL